MSEPRIKVLADADGIARAAADLIVEAARDAIDARGAFTLGLSGGSTPRTLYRLLAGDEYRNRIDWPHVEIFFGDERCVPPDHSDSNYRMANEELLSKVPLDPAHIHRMRGEIDPQEAAKEYGLMLKRRFGDDGGLDLLLLGMGDDGHTASLFPGTPALSETKHRCVANFVPKFNTWRITLTVPFINRAGEILVLASGASKANVVQQVLEGEDKPGQYPIQLISPASGKLIWLLDLATAGMASDE